ncbi:MULTISPECIES: mersacidin family lantibiotic [unclassified Exiguobacterium]|uniref:mersacidin family lantibiotic n=1 Tax=unclassified Exiguobacterium TaxID=2644629 RepID=UPI001BE9EFF1|nr:mersacidin family lantibiotic [Exiguobacterium sp. s132]
MLRNEALKKVASSNPAGDTLTAMSMEELSRVNGGGDVGAELTPTTSTYLCIGVGIRLSSQKCAYVGGTIVSGVLSNAKC